MMIAIWFDAFPPTQVQGMVLAIWVCCTNYTVGGSLTVFLSKKSFSKREVIGKLCIEEVRVDLEHLCSCSWKQCRIFHEDSHKNNYPLVLILCIVKLLCQDLPLG